MTKFVEVSFVMADLLKAKEEISSWKASDGGLTWAACAALGIINGCIERIKPFDHISSELAWEIDEVCFKNGINLGTY